MSKLIGTKINSYTELSDGTLWPNPEKAEELSRILRRGDKDEILSERLYIASMIDAYNCLIQKTQKRRNEICQALKEAT